MAAPLMPKATAVWLVENTTLTFEQIADFCGLHALEVRGIADGDVATGVIGRNPVIDQQVTREEIERCEKDPKARLLMVGEAQRYIEAADRKKQKSGRYTPIA